MRVRGTWDEWGGDNDSKTLPVENNTDAIQQVLWKVTNDAYKNESDKYAKVKANIAVKVEKEDKSADFSKDEPNVYIEPRLNDGEIRIDIDRWKEKIKKYSLPFLDEPAIYEGNSSFSYKVLRKYFVSSEGSMIAQNLTYTRIFVNGEIKADDGMELPFYKDFFAFMPSGLPADEVVINAAKDMVKKLQDLKKAPLAETFTGPALLSSMHPECFS